MVNFFLHIYDYLQNRKRLYWGLLISVIIILLMMVSFLSYNENIHDFLPMDDNERNAITLYQDISGGSRIAVMARMKDGNEPDVSYITCAIDSFIRILNEGDGVKHIKEITYQVDFERASNVTDFVYHHMPLMMKDSDYYRIKQILAYPDSVREKLYQDIQMLMMPSTALLSNNISYDPLGLFAPIMKRIGEQQAAMPFEMEDGYIFTANRQYAVVLLTSAYGSMESANNAKLVDYVSSVTARVMKVMPNIEFAITGSPVIAVDNARQIKADSRRAIGIATVLILALLIFSFRNARDLFLIGFSVLFGWLFATALIAVMRTNVSIIVLGIGSIIIGIAVNYPLHFVAHSTHERNPREVLKDMISPLLIGNITTVGAFVCLIPLEASALRDLGMFAAFMLIGTILFVLIFLPHLIIPKKHNSSEHLLLKNVSSFNLRFRGRMFWVILLLTCVFGYFSLGTSFDANMHHINFLTPTQKRLMSDLHISAGVNDTTNIYVVSNGDNWQEALLKREKIRPLIDSLHNIGFVQKYSDVTSFICSENEQTARIQKWRDFWATYQQQALSLLNHFAPEYGFDEDAFIEFEDIISKQYESHSFEHFEPLTSSLFVQSFSKSTGRCSVIDLVTPSERSAIVSIENTLQEKTDKELYSFDFVGMNSHIALSLSDNFNYICIACGLVVFVFLWLSFGRLELGIMAFLPMAIGWVWILGMMELLGLQFNIVNVILATFIFGQGDDYTIFITDGLINEYAYGKKLLPSYKNSILISALIMFIGMGSLIIAKHPALHSLAEVTIVGMITVVFMAWIVPPMIFTWLTSTGGSSRFIPVTIEGVIKTGYGATAYFIEIIYGCFIGFLIKFIPCRSEKKEQWFQRQICGTMKMNIHKIWGVKTYLHNIHHEDFHRGGIIISNHQSILDPILLLSLSPHIKILVSEKVWKNPIVHFIFKIAGFINMNQPIDSLKEEIRAAVEKGYNVVIFPEGQRNQGEITRFHKGAFYIAQEIGSDILPIYLHGASYVMPKNSGFASRGQIDIIIGKRVAAHEIASCGMTCQNLAHHFHDQFVTAFEHICSEIENTHYFHHLIENLYKYKGSSIERETRYLLNRYDDFCSWIDGYVPLAEHPNKISIIHAGHGQFSLLFALVHSDKNVYSYVDNMDDASLALNCSYVPKNLHICYNPSGDFKKEMEGGDILDFSDIIRSHLHGNTFSK